MTVPCAVHNAIWKLVFCEGPYKIRYDTIRYDWLY